VVVVKAPQFARRLFELTRGLGAGLPRMGEDRHILWKSAVLMIPAGEHPEVEINRCLMRWLAVTQLATDYVSWRRYLVDAGYLTRDRARTLYRVSSPAPETTGVRFEPDVDGVDVETAIAEGRRAEAAKKAAWLEGRPPL
jgi:hypothetical protein